MRKHVFYEQMIIITKGKKRDKKFFQKHTNRASQKCWKKIVWKVRKHVFYKHTNIVTKKWGGETREKIFSRKTRTSRAKNDGKKSSGKSAKTSFL